MLYIYKVGGVDKLRYFQNPVYTFTTYHKYHLLHRFEKYNQTTLIFLFWPKPVIVSMMQGKEWSCNWHFIDSQKAGQETPRQPGVIAVTIEETQGFCMTTTQAIGRLFCTHVFWRRDIYIYIYIYIYKNFYSLIVQNIHLDTVEPAIAVTWIRQSPELGGHLHTASAWGSPEIASNTNNTLDSPVHSQLPLQ